MSGFDAYYKWLGIPPEEQPPNHYRLLGLRIFERDSDVIESAAEQRMLLLRSRQTGPNAAACQRLLNEIAAAKNCLLDLEQRRAYNEQLLRSSSEQTLPSPPAPGSAAFASPPAPPTAPIAPPPAKTAPPPLPPPLPSAEAEPPPVVVRASPLPEPPAEHAADSATAAAEPPVDSWHVQTPDGSYWGPVGLAELESWAAAGRIDADCYLLEAGTDRWVEASHVLTLPAAAPKQSAPAPASPAGRPLCPNCRSPEPPVSTSAISAAGWAVFVLLLIFFCPLCFLGLLITEPRRVCPNCGYRYS